MNFLIQFLILFSIPAMAQDHGTGLLSCPMVKFDLVKTNQILKEVRTKKLGEKIHQDANVNQVQRISEDEITLKIKSIFNKIQKQMFGFNPVRLVITEEKIFSMGLKNNILISYDLSKHLLTSSRYKNGEALLAMIIGHELGHFVDLSISDREKLTINGNFHVLMAEDFKSKAIEAELGKRKLDSNEINRYVLGQILESYGHLEIDVYSLLTLASLKLNLPDESDFSSFMEYYLQQADMDEYEDMSELMKSYQDSVLKCEIKLRTQLIDQFQKDVKTLF